MALLSSAREKNVRFRRRGRIQRCAIRTPACSRKHLVALFREQVGFSPKAYASLVRFEQLTRRIADRSGESWAERAGRFGYSDQAHLIREVKRFSGLTPNQLLPMLRAQPGANVPEGFAWIMAFSALNMLVNTGGRERTAAQYQRLIEQAGLIVKTVRPAQNGFYSCFECVRA